MYLIQLALFIASTTATAPYSGNDSIAQGIAKHYTPNLMQRVLRVRQRQGLIPYGVTGYDGLASRPDCGTIGRYFWASLRNPRTGEWSRPRRMLQVDCSHPRDRQRHIRSGLVVEVDYWTARATGWGWNGRRGTGKVQARVWGQE